MVADNHAFIAHYRDEDMSAALRAFMLQTMFHRRPVLKWAEIIAMLVLVGGVPILIILGDRSILLGLLLGIYIALSGLVVMVYVMRLREMRVRIGRMAAKRATVEFNADGVSFVADSGSSTLPWRAFQDVRDRGPCWLLMLSRISFITLPKRDVPLPALAFARLKINVSPA